MTTAKHLLTTRVVEGMADERLINVAVRMRLRQAQHCVVLSAPGRFLGLISLSEVASRSNAGQRILADLVGEIPVLTLLADDAAPAVVRLFEQRGSREAVVLGADGAYVGLITAESLFDWMQAEQRAARKELEDLLSERQRLGELLDRKVDQRTAEMRAALEDFKTASLALSHDVRSPLRTIQGYADILASGEHGPLDAEGVGCARSIKRSATRLELLADDILAKARRAFALHSPATETIDLNAVLDDALEFHRALFSERRAVLRKRGRLHSVQSRYIPLLQIVSNLVANAVAYTRPGLQPVIEVWTEEANDRVKLSVKDNGRGISPSEAVRPFTPFERGASTDRAGFGLGLAIAKRAAEETGAVIALESPGQEEGSIFTVTCPAARPIL